MNVLELAWKIFKNKSNTFTFSRSMKLAWKILKISKVKISNEYFEIISKRIKKMNLLNSIKTPKGIKYFNNSYDLNILFYQLERNL